MGEGRDLGDEEEGGAAEGSEGGEVYGCVLQHRRVVEEDKMGE